MIEINKKDAKVIMAFLGTAVLLGIINFDDYLECIIEVQYRLGIQDGYISNYSEEELHLMDLDD